jgi:hypothetical protein
VNYILIEVNQMQDSNALIYEQGQQIAKADGQLDVHVSRKFDS